MSLTGLLTFETAYCHVLKRIKKDAGIPGDQSPSVKSQRRNIPDSSDDEDTKGNSLESVVLAIDTGVKKFLEAKSKPDVIDGIAKTLVDFAKNNVDPIYRSKGHEYDLKPEIIHFRSDKPSVMLELNSKSIINVLKDLLKSRTVHKYMDSFSKEAAIIYRTLKREMDKAKRSKGDRQ
uniref:Uncharacterized protein n=1 Tax=Heliothis virescens TaxID=7102 RepID=A0A2A4JEC9_HELVI